MEIDARRNAAPPCLSRVARVAPSGAPPLSHVHRDAASHSPPPPPRIATLVRPPPRRQTGAATCVCDSKLFKTLAKAAKGCPGLRTVVPIVEVRRGTF